MLSYEEKFRVENPDCRLEKERVSSCLTRYRVFVGNIQCSESGMRESAFKYALEDVARGTVKLPPRIEQLTIWPPPRD